jgi:hypothetical protein
MDIATLHKGLRDGIVILSLFLIGGLMHQAAAPHAPAYTPTELQRAHLHEAQLEAQLAQVALQQAQQNFNDKLQALRAMGDEVKKANGWPADVSFNLGDLTFSAPPRATPKGSKP